MRMSETTTAKGPRCRRTRKTFFSADGGFYRELAVQEPLVPVEHGRLIVDK
jgi:hypothetical protein